MARVTFREILETGNYITGEYKRHTRETEFEGTMSEVAQLIQSTSTYLRLPGIKFGSGLIGPATSRSDALARLLKQSERRY